MLNMNNLCLLFLVAAVSVVAAQLKCETPQVWEARMVEVNGRFDRFAKITYDAVNIRTRIIEEMLINDDNDREFYDEIFLHKEKMGYRLNLRTRQCEKFPLREPFRTIGVPPNSTLVGEFEVGTSGIPGAGVREQEYEADYERGHYFGEWIPLDHGCLPVSDAFIDRTDRRFSHWSFYDIVVGDNPDHFLIPDECK